MALSFLSDESSRKATINDRNFITFAVRDRKFIVFEDAEMFHRTPLTALAMADTIRTRRPIVRVDFYGLKEGGGTALFNLASPRPESPWREISELLLPPALQEVCRAYASQDFGGNSAVKGDGVANSASVRALLAALIEYVIGNTSIRTHIPALVQSATRFF